MYFDDGPKYYKPWKLVNKNIYVLHTIDNLILADCEFSTYRPDLGWMATYYPTLEHEIHDDKVYLMEWIETIAKEDGYLPIPKKLHSLL